MLPRIFVWELCSYNTEDKILVNPLSYLAKGPQQLDYNPNIYKISEMTGLPCSSKDKEYQSGVFKSHFMIFSRNTPKT